MNRYLLYLPNNLTHEQIALVINNYFKFDTATGELVSQREQFCSCMYTYWHHLENLSHQTHAKIWALKSSYEGTFLTKWLSKTIVICGMLRVNFLDSAQTRKAHEALMCKTNRETIYMTTTYSKWIEPLH